MTDTKGLTEDAYKSAVSAAIDLVRASHPGLDLRTGTALRSLLIEPGALLSSAQRDTVNRLRTALSLKAMERETTIPREDADAVLSNFGITLGGGKPATGLVRVNLIGTAQVTVREGLVFTAEGGASFTATRTVTASVDPADDEVRIVSAGNGTYYFTVPVEAQEVGTAGNIKRGHALSTSVILGNYASAEAFEDFTGGEDGESVAAAVARIPSALAYRGMTNALSVRAQLSASLADPAQLRAVSCVGHRDRAQLRDKHNPLGIAVGGRVDVYARLFDAPGVVSFRADGTAVGEGEKTWSDGLGVTKYRIYEFDLPIYPGFYAVKSIGLEDQPDQSGSLDYELVRTAIAGASSAHDFVVPSTGNCHETAWSAYQGGKVRVYVSDDGLEHTTTDGSDHEHDGPERVLPEHMSFNVSLYWTEGIVGLQAVVDGDDTRNVAADYVVRSPAICLVSMVASVRRKPGSAVTDVELADAVAAYVNSRSFVKRLTRSELANVLLQHGAESVGLGSGGMQLEGRICGADGLWYAVSGDSLDVSAVGPETALLTSGTVVFAADPGAIQVNVEG